MDRYLLARTGQLVRSTRRHFEDLAIADAAEDIQGYLDMLTNWYVRRSRDRFWEGDEQAIDVLSTCLETDRKSTRLNSSHVAISYAVFCLKKKSPNYARLLSTCV